MTAFTNSAATVDGTGGALTLFSNSSSAGSASFTNNGSAAMGAAGGVTVFSDSATAGNGTFINNGATANFAGGGQTRFFVSSIAGQVSFLDVHGNANLNGFLDPVLVNGFVPQIGQSFTIMNYASYTRFFSRIQNQVFDNRRKRWLLALNPTSAVLFVVKNGP